MKNASRALISLLILPFFLLGRGLAAEPDYRIGVDDILAISVWDNKDVDQVVFVRPDGKISLPLLGELQAAGLTVKALVDQLTEGYERFIKGAPVTVVVREIRSRPVFFVGGIVKPGQIQLTQDLTLLQAISLAGGLAPTADLESAYVLRADKSIRVDLVRLMQRGDVSQNITLQPGDTIVVPVADVVFVQGEVKTPSAIKFSRDLTMIKAIAQAGGVTPLGAATRVTLVRGHGTKKETLRVNVDSMMRDPNSDMTLQPNDIIIVPQRLF